MHPVWAGLCSAQSKTAENLPIPRSPHIADFAPLSKTPGAG